jgi:hypothetical protein
MTTATIPTADSAKSVAPAETPVVNMKEKLKGFLSKKLFATLFTVIVLPLLAAHGVPDFVLVWLGKVAATYVGIQGVVDTARAWTATR